MHIWRLWYWRSLVHPSISPSVHRVQIAWAMSTVWDCSVCGWTAQLHGRVFFFSFLLRAIRYVECRWRIELKYIYIFLIKVHLLHFLPSISLASCQKAAHSLDCTLGCTQVVGWKKLFSFPGETFEWDLLSLALWYCFRPLKAIGSSTLYLLSLGFHFITCLVLHWWGWW